MNNDTFFCHLSSGRIVEIINNAKKTVCYTGPGIQMEPACAMVEAAKRIGPEMVTVWIDFDERVMRMGYGDIEAVKLLRDAGILVRHAPALRSALIIADSEGYSFTPTPLYLEAEPGSEVRNALRLSQDQVAEALARLSPATKVVAVALSSTLEEKSRIFNLAIEIGSTPVDDIHFNQVDNILKEVPPVRFDLARQVRVFEPYLQYVELSLSGAAIQRHRLAIPPNIQKLGAAKDLEGRLRTTFDLIEKSGRLSSKPLEDALNEIRKNFTPSLGKEHGRVVLKAAKSHLTERLEEFREKLEAHQTMVKADLQKHLDDSRKQIIDYYLPRVMETPPDALLGQLLSARPSEKEAREWLKSELERVFPNAESIIQKMMLEVRYKDVTFETLNRDDFLELVKKAFPNVDWEKAYNEFKAAGEGRSKEGDT
jgi:hypothetical protein